MIDYKLDPEVALNILTELKCEHDHVEWYGEYECPECGALKEGTRSEEVSEFLQDFYGDNVDEVEISWFDDEGKTQIKGTISEMIVQRLGYETR